MNVSLHPEFEKLIDDEVKFGRAANIDEFLNRAVYHHVVARDLGGRHRDGDSLEDEGTFQLRTLIAEYRWQSP